MVSIKKHWVAIGGSILCYAVCIGDPIALYVFGRQYPGYCQITDTISALGAGISPVSDQISTWWVITGFVFIVFALGFNRVYKERSKSVRTATWLIVMYGLGEGFGSGLFKADHIGDSLSTSALIHDAFGEMGTIAILVLPLVMRKIFPKEEHPAFYVFSGVVLYVGLATILLFLTKHLSSYPVTSMFTGLWQRITLVDFYIYFSVVATMMLKELKQGERAIIR